MELRKIILKPSAYSLYLSEIQAELNKIPAPLKSSAYDCAVFDIDECSISNYCHHAAGRLNRNSSFEDVVKTFETHDSPAILPVLNFYNSLIENKYNIFFITGRPDITLLVKRTILNLKKVGFKKYNNLYFLPATCSYSNVAFFKKAIRDMICAKGYAIRYNIGDQKSDFLGSKAQYNIQLPNYLY